MLNRFVKSEFGKNVVTLMTGTTIAQILPVALTPVLTRLFSPEEFGAFAFFASIISILLVFSSGRYEQAIVLPKEDKDAINILGLCFSLLGIMTVLLYAILFVFHNAFVELINAPALAQWLWIIPLTLLFAGSYRILTFWSNRKKRFKGTSNSMIAQTTGRITTQFAGGIAKFGLLESWKKLTAFFGEMFNKTYVLPQGIDPIGIGALVLSLIVGFFAGTLTLLIRFIRDDRQLLQLVSLKDMKKQAKTHDKFPKINAFHALTDEFKNVGVNTTILYVFSESILGFYSMTFRVLRAPLTVIGNSFAQVFYQRASELHANQQSFLYLVNKTVKRLFLIALPIFTVILIFGPDLFAFVLGDKWRTAGEFTQYLTPWLFLNFVISPIQQVAIILNRQGSLFLLALVGNAIIFFSILIGSFVFNDIKTGFLILSILQIFYYLYVYLWIRRIAQKAH